jgi:hypothetical protein
VLERVRERARGCFFFSLAKIAKVRQGKNFSAPQLVIYFHIFALFAGLSESSSGREDDLFSLAKIVKDRKVL